MRDDEGAAGEVVGAVVEAHGPGGDDRASDDRASDDRASDLAGLPGLAHAPHGLAIATDSPPVTAFPVVSPPGACRYLQLDGVRQASCLALDPVIPLAPRQVELVCLGEAHLDCPRFARAGGGEPLAAASPGPPAPARDLGAAHVPEADDDRSATTDLPPLALVEVPSMRLGHTVGSLQVRPQARRTSRPRPAMVIATGVLAAAVVLAIGFAALHGGLDSAIGQAPAGSSTSAAGSGLTTAASAGPSNGAAASGAVATASPSAGVAAASESPTARPSGAPPSAGASPDRLAMLTPCLDQPDCYQYKIRRHDNLRGIAAFFGVPYQTVLDLNPQIENPSLIHVGQIIILPPPRP